MRKKANDSIESLRTAARHGDLGCLKKMIHQGINPHTQNEYGQTLLHMATLECSSRANALEIVSYLVNELEFDVNEPCQSEETALHHAAGHGRLDIVQFLIEAGADIHARDEYGDTPLNWAARKNKGEVVAELIEIGAEITDADRKEIVDDGTPPDILERIDSVISERKLIALDEGDSGTEGESLLDVPLDDSSDLEPEPEYTKGIMRL